MKIYLQQKANLNDSHQHIEFIFGKKISYHQIGNAYHQHEMTIETDVAVAANRTLANGNAIRLVNSIFA